MYVALYQGYLVFWRVAVILNVTFHGVGVGDGDCSGMLMDLRGVFFAVVLGVIVGTTCVAGFGNQSDAPDPQAVALHQFWTSLDGTRWFRADGWNKGVEKSPCRWFGVSCNGDGVVTSLALPSNNLVGSIPPSLASLRSLTSLNVSDNRGLSGVLLYPFSWASFPAMEVLDFSNTAYLVSIVDILLPPKLKILRLSGSPVHGEVPRLPDSLVDFRVAQTQVTGAVPEVKASMMALDVGGTLMSGPVNMDCTGVEVWEDLEYISFENAQDVSGPLPACIFDAKATPNLWFFDASSTSISGSFPLVQSPSTSHLQWLSVANTSVIGPVPPNLWQLPSLQHLDLTAVDLTKDDHVPSTILAPLTTLILRGSGVSADVLDALCASNSSLAKSLVNLDLGGNRFRLEGHSIPPCIGTLGQLQKIDFDRNEMEGIVPASIDTLAHLHTLNLAGNRLQRFDPDLCAMPSLRVLDLSENQLGDAPYVVCEGCKLQLEELHLESNGLGGDPIPLELGLLGFVEEAYLGSNCFGVVSFDSIYRCFHNNTAQSPFRYLNLGTYVSSNFPCAQVPRFQCSNITLADREFHFSLTSIVAVEAGLESENVEECFASGSWPLLQDVDLSHNSLTTLSKTSRNAANMPLDTPYFPDATQLRTLDVGSNALRSISSTFLDRLHSLRTLRAPNNPDLILSPHPLPATLEYISLENTSASLSQDERWGWRQLQSVVEVRLRQSGYFGSLPPVANAKLRLVDLSENKKAVSDLPGGAMPSSLTPGVVAASDNRPYSCPLSFIPSTTATLRSDLQVVVDPRFNLYSYCECLPGLFYGQPPNNCTRCPDDADCLTGIPLCNDEFFFDVENKSCVTCSGILGAHCPGSEPPNLSLQAQHGWWRNASDTETNTHQPPPHFLRCQVDHACHGGVNGTTLDSTACGHGYHGPLCGVCEEGYFLIESGECEECKESEAIIGGVFLVTVVPLFLCVYLGSRSTGPDNEELLEDDEDDEEEDDTLGGGAAGGKLEERLLSASRSLSISSARSSIHGKSSGHGHGHGHGSSGHGSGSGHGEHSDADGIGHAEHSYHRIHLFIFTVQILLNASLLGSLEEAGDEDGEGGEKSMDWETVKEVAEGVDRILYYADDAFSRVVGCVMHETFEFEYYVDLASPILFILILHGTYRWLQLENAWVKTLLIAFLYYSNLTVDSFYMLRCDDGNGQYGGKEYLRRDYRIECNTPDYYFNATVAVLVIACFSIGLPVGVLLTLCYRRNRDRCDACFCRAEEAKLRRRRRRLRQQGPKTTYEVFGDLVILTEEYKPPLYFWEVVELAKAGAFNVLFRASDLSLGIRFSVATALAFFFLLLQLYFQPFRHGSDNAEATLHALLISLLSFLGLLLQVGQENTFAVGGRSPVDIGEFTRTIRGLMLATLIIWVVVFLWQVVILLFSYGWVRLLLSPFTFVLDRLCGSLWYYGHLRGEPCVFFCDYSIQCQCFDCAKLAESIARFTARIHQARVQAWENLWRRISRFITKDGEKSTGGYDSELDSGGEEVRAA